VVDLRGLGERTLWIDCDVIQADGGTRTASITGAFVGMVDALRHMRKQGYFAELPLLDFVAATSVGKLGTDILLDLNYEEDSKADVDMNIVKTGAGRFVEIQGTAEDGSFSGEELTALMAAAEKGTQELIAMQRAVLGDVVLKKPKEPARTA
jgi:ribonuclease PH